MTRRSFAVLIVLGALTVACSSGSGATPAATEVADPVAGDVSTTITPTATVTPATTQASTTSSTTSTSSSSTSTTTATSPPTVPPPPSPAEAPTVPGDSTSAPLSPSVPTIAPAPGAIVAGGDIARSYPFDTSLNTSFGDQHHDYPAADIFARCGTPVVSPVDGAVGVVSPTNRYEPATDDPAARGGISVGIIGDDGVRYYMAHFRALSPGMAEGLRVARGDPVGEVGDTGRASACHLHFAISPACLATEWWVRRGAIWPQPYLESWRSGGNLSPIDEVNAFMTDNPAACDDPAAMPWDSD